MDKEIKDEDKQKIVEKLKSIEQLLQEIEDYCKVIGLKIPEENLSLESKDKIKFPSGYIRTCAEFKEKYKFTVLFPYDSNLSMNLTYALQCSDVFNYFLSRFNISLSAGKIFIKMATINIFSIIESILYGIAKNLHGYCRNKNCGYTNNCDYYVKSKYNFRELIELLQKKIIFNIDEEGKNIILDLKKTRDYIHIWDVENNEYMDELYNIENYNKLILLLKTILEYIPEKLEKFRINRSHECKFKKKG